MPKPANCATASDERATRIARPDLAASARALKAKERPRVTTPRQGQGVSEKENGFAILAKDAPADCGDAETRTPTVSLAELYMLEQEEDKHSLDYGAIYPEVAG